MLHFVNDFDVRHHIEYMHILEEDTVHAAVLCASPSMNY